jgi:hypothetical protein
MRSHEGLAELPGYQLVSDCVMDEAAANPGFLHPRPTPTVLPTQPPLADFDRKRCVPLDALSLFFLRDSLYSFNVELRAAYKVQSKDSPNFWFMAADIQGPGIEHNGPIAIWFMDRSGGAEFEKTVSVNAVAEQYSDLPTPLFSLVRDGYYEVEECVRIAMGVGATE